MSEPDQPAQNRSFASTRGTTLFALVFAGEVIYTLPYFLRRDYARAMMDSMALSQSELGYMSSMFGILALLCYGPSGYLADRVPSRILLSVAPLLTGIVGIFLVTFPPYGWLLFLFALLGITSILPFWAALIKATRTWSSPRRQGLAFGLLDGGRGLVAAILASSSVFFFDMGDTPAAGLRNVVVYYVVGCWAGSLVAYIWVPRGSPRYDSGPENESDSDVPPLRSRERRGSPPGNGKKDASRSLALARVAVLSLVLFFAYASYWGTFYLSSYAVDGYHTTHSQGARITSSIEWLRPPLAILAGLWADRMGVRWSCLVAFCAATLGYGSLALIVPKQGALALFIVQAAFVSAATFALRGMYYALLEETRVPMLLTGSIVGVVSVVGYSPDLLVPPIGGHILDAVKGPDGYRLWFGMLALLGVAGAITVFFAKPGAHTDDCPSGSRCNGMGTN